MRNSDISETRRLDSSPPTEEQLLESVPKLLKQILPSTWRVSLSRVGSRKLEERGFDGELLISAPDGTRAEVLLITRRYYDSELRHAVSLFHDFTPARPTARHWMLVAPYLGPLAREELIKMGINYSDATGNLHFVLDRPAVFLEKQGASTNPWREAQPLRSLKGPGAGRAVRALCDFRPPYGIRELAERSGASAPTLSRVVTLLEQEGLLTRDLTGGIAEVQWTQVLRRWTQDYSLRSSNKTQTYLEPRGLDGLIKKLKDTKWRHAVTGSLAAMRVAPIAPPRLAVLYVPDLDEAAERLKLRKAEHGANVLLAAPFDPVVYERTTNEGGVTYAAWTQVAADLLTSPGRGPEEAEELLKWMEAHEDAWRA